ncbi:MAG: ABC transporter ATP-binding protein [Promethearchaeota archaeon]
MHGHGGPRRLAMAREKRSRPIRVLLGRMVHYLGRFRRIVAIGAALSLIATIVSVIDPLVITAGIDAIDPNVTASPSFDALVFLIMLYIFLRITSWILSSVNTWILAGAQAGFVQNIQEDVYANLVRSDLSYHKAEQSGNVTSRVASDTVALGTGIQVLISFASQALMLVSTFVILWFTSELLALTALVVIPGVALIAVLFGTVGQRIMLASQRASGKVSGQIAENLGGIHIAKAFNREKELAEEMMDLNQRSYKFGLRFMILMSAMQPLVRSLGQFATAAILFVGGSMAVGTLPLLTIGEVFLGVMLISRFMWPLLSLSMMASQVQASMAAMDRISDVLDSKRAIDDAPDAIAIWDRSDGITFENLTFEYVPDTPVLKGVNFTINPGEMVAVVGHTGAGKTTLAALINRFYDPQEGRVLIGEQDIRDITLKSLHDTVSLIPQEPYLFDDTIMENIRYGKPTATDEEIIGLCKIIGANEFIEVLADGYDTKVIENGKNLSAGQRQMITIARTMLADPRILILDEATSRLDAYSESLVQDAQAQLFANRTTVVIAHRLTTIANASRIIVFDHGEIIEEGSHEELLALNGTFKALYDTYYAHQGIEELTEEVATVAAEEVAKTGGDEVRPMMPGAMHGGMSGGMMGGMQSGMQGMGSHGGMPVGELEPTPEMIERIRERLKSDPDSIPPQMREMLREMIEADGEGDKKDKPKDDELARSGTMQQGPVGSGRPSPQMIKALKERYKEDPSSIPKHMHAHIEKMIKEEAEGDKD